jgi:hypothetical protein
MEGLSVAANIIQAIDAAGRLISNSIQIYRSQDGQAVERRELEQVTGSLAEDVRNMQRSLKDSRKRGGHTDAEKGQNKIGQQCEDIANELLMVLQRLKYKGTKSPLRSVRQALLSAWNDDKIQELEHRLDRYRQQMITTVLTSLW